MELIAYNGRDIVSTIEILTFQVTVYTMWKECTGKIPFK